MFNWILKWFRKDSASDIYHPKERKIYWYFNGDVVVRADPMAIYRKLMEVRFELANHFKVSESPFYKDKPDGKVAAQKAQAMIRNIFDLKTFSEGGLTELEAEEVLNHFIFYMDVLKKNSNQTPTSPEETSASSEPSSEESPPIPNTLDSGSTENDSSSGKQEQSPSEQALPSEDTNQKTSTS